VGVLGQGYSPTGRLDGPAQTALSAPAPFLRSDRDCGKTKQTSRSLA
jgi:hypothetical protein